MPDITGRRSADDSYIPAPALVEQFVGSDAEGRLDQRRVRGAVAGMQFVASPIIGSLSDQSQRMRNR